LNSLPNAINSYFDPQVEFLELGVSYGTQIEWKLVTVQVFSFNWQAV
jgi:hypothetical protein